MDAPKYVESQCKNDKIVVPPHHNEVKSIIAIRTSYCSH